MEHDKAGAVNAETVIIKPHEFRWLLKRSGITIAAFSRFIGRNRKTVERLFESIEHEIPVLYIVALTKLLGSRHTLSALRNQYKIEEEL